MHSSNNFLFQNKLYLILLNTINLNIKKKDKKLIRLENGDIILNSSKNRFSLQACNDINPNCSNLKIVTEPLIFSTNRKFDLFDQIGAVHDFIDKFTNAINPKDKVSLSELKSGASFHKLDFQKRFSLIEHQNFSDFNVSKETPEIYYGELSAPESAFSEHLTVDLSLEAVWGFFKDIEYHAHRLYVVYPFEYNFDTYDNYIQLVSRVESALSTYLVGDLTLLNSSSFRGFISYLSW